jgi:hypothetical protein
MELVVLRGYTNPLRDCFCALDQCHVKVGLFLTDIRCMPDQHPDALNSYNTVHLSVGRFHDSRILRMKVSRMSPTNGSKTRTVKLLSLKMTPRVQTDALRDIAS